jgi:Plavaka transposase
MMFCPKCQLEFARRRALQAHLLQCRFTESSGVLIPTSNHQSSNNSNFCNNPAPRRYHEASICSPNKNIENQENDDDNFNIFHDDNSCDTNLEDNNNKTNSSDSQCGNNVTTCNSLLLKAQKHFNSELWEIFNDESEYKAAVELLDITTKARVPINLFDKVMNWANISANKHKVIFGGVSMTRKKVLEQINRKYDLKDLKPQTTSVFCEGYGGEVDVVWHDFDECLYSLLMDRELMKSENLLWYNDDDSQNHHLYDDVDTGSAYKDAMKTYIVNPESEKLIPLIFFTDKTHTDMHGRLCLEPVQFTLGIFKREIRNLPRAWRTLGYATDVLYKGKCDTRKKLQDYHTILNVILQKFKERQSTPLQWQFFGGPEEDKVYTLKLPVMYIIGDTEGHDRLCGRMTSRNTITHLCRYCNVSRDDTDDPYCEFQYTKMRHVKNLIQKGDADILKEELSMYLIKNAWHDIMFCDPKRGIHGATCGELLHCLQQGIFEYSLIQLFELKKESKRKNQIERSNAKKKKKKNPTMTRNNEDSGDERAGNDVEEDTYEAPNQKILSSHNVFSEKYSNRFETICQQYGKMLQHQSDRNLPRTYFHSKYLAVTKKNGHEMAGLILVFLIIFLTDEGQHYLDREIGPQRCAAFIHVFELLLMLESFCKQDFHKKRDLKVFQESIPHVMYTIKNIVQRNQGCGFKIIKFHLMKHFVDDILRFGSMKNFDSAIGERNHCTEVKEPAQHTQRRKSCFEIQTALRYSENIATGIAASDIKSLLQSQQSIPVDGDECVKKRSNIVFCYERNDFFKRNATTRKLTSINWPDKEFQRQLRILCVAMVESGSIRSPINLFTQNNRKGVIFRADPEYDDGYPWYDWAKINWDDGDAVPAKLMIYVDLNTNLSGPFKYGDNVISERGYYAVGHSFVSANMELAHKISNLVTYGEIMCREGTNVPILWIFPIDSIMEHCISVPFKVSNNIINAKKWLIIKSKDVWYTTFLTYLKERCE